jgi:hypothetical protein
MNTVYQTYGVKGYYETDEKEEYDDGWGINHVFP